MAGNGAGSKLNEEAGCPMRTATACSNWSRADVMSMSCGARLFELRGGQVHVFPGSDAALKTALRELQGFVEGVYIGIEKLFLRIQSAQGQVIQGQFRVQAEANRFQIRGRGLRQGAAGLHASPDASPDVRFVGDISREHEIGIIDGSGRRRTALYVRDWRFWDGVTAAVTSGNRADRVSRSTSRAS